MGCSSLIFVTDISNVIGTTSKKEAESTDFLHFKFRIADP